jgi:hypothetical protein
MLISVWWEPFRQLPLSWRYVISSIGGDMTEEWRRREVFKDTEALPRWRTETDAIDGFLLQRTCGVRFTPLWRDRRLY